MKSSPRTLCLFVACCAALFATHAQSADAVVGFTAKPVVGIEQKQPDGLKAEIAASPQAGGPDVLKLSWPAHEAVFIAGYINDGGVLISEPGAYRITAKVSAEQLGPECATLALRLLDKRAEVYQLIGKITPGEPGWIEVSWTLQTDDPAASRASFWGGMEGSRGVIDLPLRLRGFALNFTGRATIGGALVVETVKAEPLR